MRTSLVCTVTLTVLTLRTMAFAQEPPPAGSAAPTPAPSTPVAEEPAERPKAAPPVDTQDAPAVPRAEAPKVPARSAPGPERGDPGTPCAARWHCRLNYRCYRQVCVEESAFVGRIPEGQPQVNANAVGRQVRPYVGSAIGVVLPAIRTNWAWGARGPQFSVRGGLSFEPKNLQGPIYQLQLDVGLTGLFGNDRVLPSGLVETTVTAAALVPIGPRVWWVLRAGGGGALTRGGWSREFSEVRVDIMSVLIRTSEHVQVELAAPSFRYFVGSVPEKQDSYSPNEAPKLMMWVTSVAVDYVF